MKKVLQSSKLIALVAGFLVFWGVFGLRNAGYLEILELAVYDWFIRLQPKMDPSDHRVVIIGIHEEDIRKQGRWPLTDATLAQALQTICHYGPRAIGLDIYRDFSVPPGRLSLDAVLSENKNIIVVTKFGEDGIPPPAILRGSRQVGFNDILVDPGGVVRRALLFLDDGENVFYSFPLRLAFLYLRAEGISPRPDPKEPAYIRLGPATIKPLQSNDGGYAGADARGYQFLVDYKNTAFPTYTLTSLLSGELNPESMKDKIVLIGSMAQSVQDLYYTPLSRGLLAKQQLWGVELHAHVLNQLIGYALEERTTIRVMGERSETLWLLFWSLMGGLAGLWIRSAPRFSIWGAVSLLSLYGIAHIAFISALWIPLVPPAMAWVVSASLVTAYMTSRERRYRAILMRLFSKCVSREIADIIWQQRDQVLQNGRPRDQRVTVTTLYVDMKGFSSVTEGMAPESVMEWLNIYMDAMTRLIMQYGGVIDRFAGDGIKADFGIPIPRRTEQEIGREAVRAVDCALAMGREMERLTIMLKERRLPDTQIRIGIFTGPAIAGTIGSEERMQYTTLGDAVNIAARLESYDKTLAKESTCRILIGESTLRYTGERFQTEKIGEAALKGIQKKVTIYRVIGHNPKRNPSDRD